MTTLMIWLVPAAGATRDRLATTIERLAAEHAAPRFPPHVTMVGTILSTEQEAVRTLTALVAGVPPFDVNLRSVGYEQAYFRALFLRADPSPQLTSLHEAGQRAWALNLPPYQPHLSLLYTDIAAERKQQIIDTIGLRLPLTIRIDAGELWADDGQGVVSWRRVARVPLLALPESR